MKSFKGRSRSIPICLFCYHKAGTKLLTKAFSEICAANHLRFRGCSGKQTQVPADADVILFRHSLIDVSRISKPFVGVHIVRDPRDVIVSGYLYHRRTTEQWCINTDFSLTPPIRRPRVPSSQEHRPREWKVSYLKSLAGKSYQENLLQISQERGLMFEMDNHGAWTIESMMEWKYNMPNILEITFENLMNDYDGTLRRIFAHIGFSKSATDVGLKVAVRHDLGRKSPQEIENMPHVSSPRTTKWRRYFSVQHKEAFLDRFGDVLVQLGYETDNNW
ncbi:MAG: sulfotransferase domain-containing protein [Arenicellales bacterium]